jgi:F-type H+-transporting ATPase subunit delta
MKTSKQVKGEARQLFRWCLVGGTLQKHRAREVSTMLLRSKRRGYLQVLTCFYRLVKLESSNHTAQVQSAVLLGFDLAHRIHGGLTDRYGQGLAIQFAQDPALIGGIRIKVGSDVYDSSVQSRLRALESGL